MTRLREERGMTLPELLIAMVIGMIVATAAFGLIEFTMKRAGDTGARVEATQRGRAALDFITRQLRSQVCTLATPNPAGMNDDRAIYAATPTSVTFFSDLGDESYRTGNTPKPPEMRQISFENGRLYERRWTGTSTGNDANPSYTFAGYPSTPTQVRLLADNITALDANNGQPVIFRYFLYTDSADPTDPPVLTELPSPASATVAQLTTIARIDIKFQATRVRGKSTDRGRIQLQDSVYSRLADPNNVMNPKPVCV
jgi:prepilin-type N-terminal cleavage/methylation domain-containing protein